MFFYRHSRILLLCSALLLGLAVGCIHQKKRASPHETAALLKLADSLTRFEPSDADSLYRSILSDSLNLAPEYITKSLIGLSEIFITRGNTDTAELLLRKATIVAENSHDTNLMMNTLLASGNLKLDQGDNDNARGYYEQGLALAMTKPDTVFQNRFLLNLGNIQNSGGDFPSAINTYMRSIALAEKRHDDATLAVALQNLAITLSNTGEITDAEKNIKRSIAIWHRLNRPREYAQALQNLGILYRKEGKSDSALLVYRQAHEILAAINDSINLVRVRYNIGLILKNQKKFGKAESEMYSIIDFCRQHRIYDGIGLAYSALASIYAQTGRAAAGITAIDSAIAFAVRTQNFGYLPFHLDRKHEILNGMGQYKEAYEVLIRSWAISDSLLSIEKQKEIASIRTRYQTAKKDAENLALKKDLEVKSSRLLLSRLGLVGGSIIFIIVIILLWTRHRQLKQEALLAEETSKRAQYERSLAEETSKRAYQESLNKEIELEKARIENLLKDKELESIQLEANLKEERIGQLELQGQLQEQRLVFESLVHAELTQINRSVLETMNPFKLKISRKKDQDDFSKALSDLTRNALKEPMAEFEILFRQIHGSYYEKLLQYCPGLSKTELNICALIRLNLSSKDMARITNLSVTTIETTRHHIRKKLDLDPGANLTTFMIGL